ncbi:MAG: hypothetical protein WBC92_07665, partial [Terracidiphilus sp.]
MNSKGATAVIHVAWRHQGHENAGHFCPGLKAVRPRLLFISLKAAAPSVLNGCVISPGQFSGQILR